MDVGLVDHGITEDPLDGIEDTSEEVVAQLFEMITSERSAEVDAVEEVVDFDESGGSEGECSLGTLTGGAEATESTRVGGDIFLVLKFELRSEVVYQSVVEFLATQVGVTRGGPDLDDTFLDGEEGDIVSSSAKIEDEDITLIGGSPVETVGDCSSGGLVDDAEDVQATDGTSLPGGPTLGAIEVSGDGNDGSGNDSTEARFCSLPHLGQNHGGYFLRRLRIKSGSRSRSVEKWRNSQIPYPRRGIGP